MALPGMTLTLMLASSWAAFGQEGESYSPVYVADSLAAQEHVDEANRLLAENRPLDAAAALQPVIETLADKLIALEPGVYVSAALWVERHVRDRAALRDAYRQAFGPTAERMWLAARATLDERAIAEVFDRFGLTDAGREAGLALAALRLEAADADGAGAVLDRLPRLHERASLGARYELLAAAAAVLTGDGEAAAAHRAALHEAGAARELAQLDALAHRVHPPSRLRPAEADVRPPRANAPLWSLPLTGESETGATDSIARYRAANYDGWLSTLPTVAPRDDGGRDVLINTANAVLAADQVSGWTRWTYVRPLGVNVEELEPQMRLALQRGQPILDRRGVLVLGDRAFTVLGEAVYWTQRRQPTIRMTELVCLDRETGRPLWQFDPETLDAALAQCFFVGTPASDGRLVYVAARRFRTSGFLDSFLVAVDPLDGSLVWRRHLSSLATRQRATLAPPIELLLDTGRIYVHDCAATVASIDARSGRTHWLRVLVSGTQVDDGRRSLRARTIDDTISPLVLCAAGLIVPSNNEARVPHVLDPDTGAIRGTLDAGPWTGVKVFASAGADVLAIGDHVTLFDGATLEPIWSQPAGGVNLNTAPGAPRATARHVYISAADGVRILDRHTGELEQTLAARETGNVLALDGQVLLATPRRIDSYLNWADAYAELRRRTEASPDDPRQGVALAYLAMNAREPDAVLEGVDAALGALRRGAGAPRHAAMQSLTFEQLLNLAQPYRAAGDASLATRDDPALRQQVYDRLRTIATTPAQRIAYHFAAAALGEQREQWATAVEHYQALLTDRELASQMHRQDQLVQRTGDAARRKLERLVERHGPLIYQRYSDAAVQQLAALDAASADADALIELAETYPLAPASPRALMIAATRYRQQGELREATRQLRRAYPRAEEPALIAQISGELASAYEAQALPHRAAQWLRRVAREHPLAQPLRDGRPLDIDAWLARLARHDAASGGTLPDLSPPMGDARRIDGRLLWPEHPDATSLPRDRFLIARGQTLALHTVGEPDAPRWTQTLPADDAVVLTFDEESVLLWSPRDGRLWGLDAMTGEPAWEPLDAGTELEQIGDASSRAAAMSAEQRRFMEMVDNEPLIRNPAQLQAAQRRNVFTAADESVICFVDDTGRVLGADRWTGRVLWRAMTMLDRAGPAAIGSGVLAVAGVVGENTTALGGGLLVLDAQTGEKLFPLIEDRDPVTWLGVASNGLLVAISPRMVTAYHIETGEVAWRYQAAVPAMIGQAWMDGSTLLAQSEGGAIEMIDLDKGSPIRRLPLATSPRQVLAMAASDDAPRWLMLNNTGLSALDRAGDVRWRDAVEREPILSRVQAAASDAAVMVGDDGQRTWVWCFEPATGRLIDERRYERGTNLQQAQALDRRLLVSYEDCVLLVGD